MDEHIHLTFMDMVLDNNKKEYQIGDQVSGILKIRMKGRLELCQLKIRLTCTAEVNWVEHPNTRYHKDGHVYHDETKIFDNTYAIPGQYGEGFLNAGEHEIPFSLKLPEKDIPSSFRSTHGSVIYYVEGVINAMDEVHRIGTEIVVDAPFRQHLNLSIGNSVEKDLGFLSCGSGKLILYASLPKKGFVAGESIELHITVENNSTVEATARATLYQNQIYMCGERHKAFEEAITDAVVGHTVGEDSELTETLLIPIPKDVSLTIKSGMINIKYFVHVTLDIPHAFDIHLNLPIIITNESALNSSDD